LLGQALKHTSTTWRNSFEDRLARFKHPREVIIVDALPKNALGKTLRYQLRAAATHRLETVGTSSPPG